MALEPIACHWSFRNVFFRNMSMMEWWEVYWFERCQALTLARRKLLYFLFNFTSQKKQLQKLKKTIFGPISLEITNTKERAGKYLPSVALIQSTNKR